MSLTVKDANSTDRVLKTTEESGEHKTHHLVDNFPTDLSKEAKQDTLIAAMTLLLAYCDGQEGLLTSILNKLIAAPATESKQDTLIAKDFATQTTLAQLLAKIIAAPSTEAKQDDLIAQLISIIKAEDSVHTSGDKGIMLLGLRSDFDSSTANDGDYTIIKLDEEGRLKVSSKPASYPDVTGDITAIQATIGTPVAGGTVVADVIRASNVMIFCQGTFSTINCTFEGSLEISGDNNWFGIQAVRSNANTIETTTGNLSAQPAYSWEMSVNALKRVRVRCTARTSGTQSWRFVLGTYATEPIPAAQVSATQPVSGTVTVASTTANIGTSGITQFTDSSTNLGISGVFTGTSRDGGATAAFNKFVANAMSDQAGTIRIEKSTDNTTWRRASKDIAVAANSVEEITIVATARYHRVVYTNGGVAQTVFLLTSAYLRL